jgi:hypothetical protein
MSFSLPRFLRRMQPSELQTYFAVRDITFSEQVDWIAKPEALLHSLKAAIEALPERAREQVFADFERVDQLSDEIGQRALHSLIEDDEALLRKFHSCNGTEARGLFVLLKNEDAFDHALTAAYAERLRHGRSWSGFSFPAPLTPSNNSSNIVLLEADLSALFHEFDGTGRKLRIESFERRITDFSGSPAGPIIHYSVYVEGLPECTLEFERNEPKRRTRRPVIEAAFCCDPINGTLDVVSKGGRPLREDTAKAFAERLLGAGTILTPVSRRDFELSRLKRPITFPTDPVDGVKTVKITLLRLRNIASQFGYLTIEIDDAESGDIHTKSARWFGDSDPLPLQYWQVTQAKLKIAFHPETAGKRAKTITVELRAPNGSNLRDQTRRHQIISEKYLARWGLIKKGMAEAA